jgi:hypothetical protein
MALVSDRDREDATVALRRHYASGALSLSELTERLQIALTARRGSDLAVALRELAPSWRDPADLYRRGQAAAMRGRLLASRALFLAKVAAGWMMANLLLLAVFGVIAAVHGVGLVEVSMLPLAWVVTTLLAFVIVRRTRERFRLRR